MAPRKRAGENVPPKKPKPIQQLVNINLVMMRRNKNETVIFSVITLSNVSVPKPKTSSIMDPEDIK